MPIEWAVKDNYAPKEMGSNKQRIRRRRNPSPCSYNMVEKGRILWYNKIVDNPLLREEDEYAIFCM